MMMSRIIPALVIIALLSGCGHSQLSPREITNACTILQQRSDFKRAFRAAERKWGVPVHVQMATIYQESKFKGNARPPIRWAFGIIPLGRPSTAYGYSQALDGTWDEYRKERKRRFASRTNIRDSADFIGWYMYKSHRQLGIPLNDARNQYLAYHEGRAGYKKRSYRSKGWLVQVAKDVAARSATYKTQIGNCRRI